MVTLEQAIGFAKSGHKAIARELLAEIVSQEPENETAWLWLSSSVADYEERRACLEKALEINPDSAAAKRGLEILSAKSRERISSPQPEVTPRSQAKPTTRELTPEQLEAKRLIEGAGGRGAFQSNGDAQSNTNWIMGIGIVSPPLNKYGNSFKGVETGKLLANIPIY